ncbi:MAG: hypothetical protein ABIQ97_04150 [Lysobacteraceae bacterium]
MSERREPVLGKIERIDAPSIVPDPDLAQEFAAAVADRTPPRRPRRPRWPWLLAIAVAIALGAGALLLWRAPLSNRLVPVPRQTLLLRDAERALAQGRLTAVDGSGAAELFQAVAAIDPDQQSAHEGLARVAQAALAQARADLQHGRNTQARDALELAHRLAAPAADVEPLDAQLRKSEGAGVSIDTLLDQAAAAEKAGHLDDGDQAALALYQQALAVAPGNAVVLSRRNALLSTQLDQAVAQAQRGDLDAAQAVIDRVAAIDPGHLDLPFARAHEATARQQQDSGRSRLLDRADADLRNGRVDAAVRGYRAATAQDAGESRAIAGLHAAAEAYLVQANNATSDFDFARAESLLTKASALSPEATSLNAATQHLRTARAQRNPPAEARLSREQRAQLDGLLEDATRAMRNDKLLDPPGDSAYDKLRAAAAIAPADPAVRAAQRDFGPAAVACFERALTANQLDRAEGCLQALTTVAPGFARLSSMREALAERWLAVADERLGAGEFRAVRHALDSARQLSPRLHGLTAMEARLELARRGNR